jgi:hypothetical protein
MARRENTFGGHQVFCPYVRTIKLCAAKIFTMRFNSQELETAAGQGNSVRIIGRITSSPDEVSRVTSESWWAGNLPAPLVRSHAVTPARWVYQDARMSAFSEDRSATFNCFGDCPGFRANPSRLKWRAIDYSEPQDRNQKQGPQRHAERHPQAPKLWDLVAGKQSEMWPEKPLVAKHASPRNDEEAFQYPLQQPVSFRTTNIGAPTYQAHRRSHGRLHPYLASCFGG